MRRTMKLRYVWITLGGLATWAIYSAARAGTIENDVVATLRADSAATLNIEGTSTPVQVTQGLVGLKDQTPTCVASAGHPCSAVLTWFSVSFPTVTVSTSEGTFTVDSGTVAIPGQLPVQDQGSGFVVPQGTSASFSGGLSGVFANESTLPETRVLTAQPLSAPAVFHLSVPTQDLTISGTFPFSMTSGTFTVQGSITFSATANKPFTNLAPVANAGPDQIVPCGQNVTLNGSGSTDPNNNITSYTWLKNGAIIATGATASVTLPLGQSAITLQVQDAFGGVSSDVVQVTVDLGDSASCCPSGTNVIIGTSNNDTINGTTGSDCIIALGGQDTIHGNGGNDIISGGDGDDVIVGGSGNDLLFGGTGQDQLSGMAGNDTLSGDDGDDTLDGGDGDDILVGGQGQDHITCGTGTNQAFGGIGDDVLTGGSGNDLLDGGPDHNTCIGGGGSDTFVSCTTIQ